MFLTSEQCDQKKIAKCLWKLPKNYFTRETKDFDTFTKMPKNMEDLGKLIAAKGFKKLPKVQKNAQYGHTAPEPPYVPYCTIVWNTKNLISRIILNRWWIRCCQDFKRQRSSGKGPKFVRDQSDQMLN